MPRGGKRKGAGRPANPEKKISYATKLKPEYVAWLRSHERGFATKFIESAIEEAMRREG